jgi:hypothetical protein
MEFDSGLARLALLLLHLKPAVQPCIVFHMVMHGNIVVDFDLTFF